MNNKEKPLVSIISGFYNREFLVRDSIKSLINQTYRNIEIIVFDDCSTDDTYEQLKFFEDADKRVRVISHFYNKGFVQGLIDAVASAKGELIAIHGSGDISLPERIEKQVKVHKSCPNVSVVGCFYANTYKGQILDVRKEPVCGDFYRNMLKKNLFSHGEVMFKKKFYDKVGGYRNVFKYSQDRDLWFRMSLISEYRLIDEVLYHRVNDDKNSIRNNRFSQLKQAFYSELSKQSVIQRKKTGYDFVDILGTEALGLLKMNKNMSMKIARIAIQSLIEDNEIAFSQAYQIIKRQNIDFYSLLVILLEKKIVNRKLFIFLLKKCI
jgi:glycosyltransferase involved in cell wall biosynthesis